jgi:hypothetical protein
MKKTSRGITHPEPTRRRGLRLSKEAIRTLLPEDLARAAGGADCVTTSWTTEGVPQTQGTTVTTKGK